MKRIILLVAASLFLDVLVAKSVQGNLNDDLVMTFIQAESIGTGRKGDYNYVIDSSVNSLGFILNTQLTPAIYAGLGLMFGGTEIEVETLSSIVELRGSDIDINRLLGVNVKLKFIDIIPYVNLGYYIESRNKQLSFSVNVGIKFLQLSSVSVNLDGEIGDLLNHNNLVVSIIQREIRQDLEKYYLEPVMQMNINYVFN